MLLIEEVSAEKTVEEIGGKKFTKITGPFLMHSKKNRNGRIYGKKIMEKAVNEYKANYIDKNRALGELNHPEKRASVDPERACILTEKLELDGDYYIGTARVLSTPLGKLVECLLNDGVTVGVSSRGLGDLTKTNNGLIVGDNYEIRTAADVVFDPSVANAFVDVIMEDTEYIKYGEILVEKDLYEMRDTIRLAKMSDLESIKLKAFTNFIQKISTK